MENFSSPPYVGNTSFQKTESIWLELRLKYLLKISLTYMAFNLKDIYKYFLANYKLDFLKPLNSLKLSRIKFISDFSPANFPQKQNRKSTFASLTSTSQNLIQLREIYFEVS